MSIIQIYSILPLIIISLAPLLIIIFIAIKRSESFTYLFSLVSLVTALISIYSVYYLTPISIGTFAIVDSYSLLYLGIIIISGIFLLIFSHNYLLIHPSQKEEYYVLFFCALLGSAILTIANNFTSLFIGIEILSISLYAMISYLRHKDMCIEAGIKYLIIASASSAILIFGIALLYLTYGELHFKELGNSIETILSNPSGREALITIAGYLLIIGGISFKLALVPFHMWAPDVYQGSPAPVSAFIASISKGGVFAVFMRFLTDIRVWDYEPFLLILSIIAILSMFTGNLLALLQNNLKRLLAYSSIANLGYLMIALIVLNASGMKAGTFFIISYFITILGAFGIISVLSPCERDSEDIKDYKSLFWRKPFLALVLSAMMFSLAGLPLTVGFFGKFYLLTAGIENYQWVLIFSLIINSAISIYYYLRVIVSMFHQPQENEIIQFKIMSYPNITIGSKFALFSLLILLTGFGIYPTFVLDIIDSMLKMG